MFTQTLTKRVKRSALLDLLTGPHGVDRYTELVDPTWTRGQGRARVVEVRRTTPRSVTLTLAPNRAFTGFRAGQHINVSVDIDGRRRTRPYSPANGEGDRHIELTIGRHDGGLVSNYLYEHARRGMVVGLDSVGGDFTLSDRPGGKILFVSGGSGITPVMSMLRTLRSRRHTGEVVFIHYARSVHEACYRAELAEIARAMPNVTVLHGYTRDTTGSDLEGRFCAAHTAMEDPDAVYACGPPVLVDAVREVFPHAESESFVPPEFTITESSGGNVSFTGAGIDVVDDGQPILNQAENAGLTPESGCRMGICFSCTRRKTSGAVRNVITGAISSTEEEDVQICVSAPVGDVVIDL
ncbi:ferredoxin reductase [Mycolicibacterium sp. BiH015]|uniref:ferredoxin reductase n=1 Tax=Mycolicibacterium sp. BiH015 TaxID=3018808 RepID=UPI0022E31908|nr:ferredoxin reductase [Mycolicibacterium sp. BiH015]MDA2894651.1 ferredoxin reductase [Mycolicibacterium sp. BiH015]